MLTEVDVGKKKKTEPVVEERQEDFVLPETAEEAEPEEVRLVEAPYGYKTQLMKDLLLGNPGVGNKDLAGMFLARMAEQGYKEERDSVKIANHFSNLRSEEKRRQEGGGEDGRSRGRPTGLGMRAQEPTLGDLLKVKELARDEEGGIEGLSGRVARVEELAREVGSLELLRKCLDALALLTGEEG